MLPDGVYDVLTEPARETVPYGAPPGPLPSYRGQHRALTDRNCACLIRECAHDRYPFLPVLQRD